MFDISVIEVDNQKDNIILKKSINLDVDLDCFIMISCSDAALVENLMNNVLENIIDKISKEETYNDFGIALENINSFLETWNLELKDEGGVNYELDMSISILNENALMFSNIGKATVYLVNNNSEVIELTERDENKKTFLFISSGILANSEIIISSTLNILKYLSKSDIIDGMVLSNDIEIFNKNIKNILQSEIVNKNCIISSMKYKNEVEVEENEKIAAVKEMAVKALETNFSKKIISKFLLLKEKIGNQSKATKNVIFTVFLLFLIMLLYLILSGIVGKTTRLEEKQITKNQIEEIREYLADATKNIGNPIIFDKNIEKAEVAVKGVEEKNVYINDVQKLKEEINILKKQFNKIELFNSGKDNLVYAEESDLNARVISDGVKTYIVNKKGIVGPIVGNSKPKSYIFNSLGDKEEFVDGGILGQDVYLVTNTSKVVRFNRNGNFDFANVSGQKSWENIKSADFYSGNIYTLADDNRVRKHPVVSGNFGKGSLSLQENDVKNLGNLRALTVDGGIYLVGEDITKVVKLYTSPYRIEGLKLNKLPKNYSIEKGMKYLIKARINLNYVYMLIDDKIFVFKPNATDWKSTRDLTFIGQIEGNNEKIIDFHINSDGELIILNKKGLFKLRFEVSDDKLFVR